MNLTAAEIAAKVESLISLPAAGVRVAKTLNNESSTPQQAAAVIEADPSLTAALLRMANSSAINRGKQIDSVSKAVTVLGREQVKSLALGVSISSAFKGLPTTLVSVQDFWKHSLYCATAARLVALKAGIEEADTAFTAGLLHDIGHLVMFAYQPEQSIKALEASREAYDGILNYQTENELLGFDHTDIGAELARLWELPDTIIECIDHHHAPLQHDKPSDLLMAVHIANTVAILSAHESEDLSEAPPIEAAAWEQLGLKWFDLIELMDQCREQTAELTKLLNL